MYTNNEQFMLIFINVRFQVIYQLLLDWKQANTRDAQLGTLVSILWSCQEYDCVERLVAARKNPS